MFQARLLPKLPNDKRPPSIEPGDFARLSTTDQCRLRRSRALVSTSDCVVVEVLPDSSQLRGVLGHGKISPAFPLVSPRRKRVPHTGLRSASPCPDIALSVCSAQDQSFGEQALDSEFECSSPASKVGDDTHWPLMTIHARGWISDSLRYEFARCGLVR